jgi:hypothetical protein
LTQKLSFLRGASYKKGMMFLLLIKTIFLFAWPRLLVALLFVRRALCAHLKIPRLKRQVDSKM